MTSFGTKLRGNEKLAELADKLQNGTAAYADAYEYALEVGTALSDTFGEELSSDVLPDGKMYFNIANRVVRDPLTRAYQLIADECEGVQKKLNTAAGIGLKAQRPDYPENRIKGFIDRLSSEPDYDKVSWMLKEPVKTFSESIVDDSVKKNAEMHYNAGLSPQIIRSAAAHCCEWCNDVAGTYPYPNVPKDVYRRHNFCRCQVEYDPRNGKRQDVHTRRWSDQEGYVRYGEIEYKRYIETGGKRYETFKPTTRKERAALAEYKRIAKRNDINVIAQNSGFTESDIEIIKRHLFYDKHKKYDTYDVCDPDYDIAVAWNRLYEGNTLPRDLTLLHHELLEAKVEKDYNLSLAEAHEIAKREFDWEKQVIEEAGEKGERFGLLQAYRQRK